MTTLSTNHSIDGPANVPLSVDTGRASVPQEAAKADAAQRRAERTLEDLEVLTQLLADEPPYLVPPLDWSLPEDFKLSVVIPVFNEARTIQEVLGRVSRLPVPKEIIVVDDHSTDGTRDLLRPLERMASLRIVYKPENEGKGAALRTGFQYATGDIVVVQDADLEYDPRDIPPLLQPILEGRADVVYGSRFLAGRSQDPSLLHRLGNRALTRASNLLTGLHLSDMETCYKAFRRDVLRSLTIQQDRFGFEPEVTAKLARRGYRILEVPIRYRARGYQEGKKIGLKDLLSTLYCIVRYGLAD